MKISNTGYKMTGFMSETPVDQGKERSEPHIRLEMVRALQEEIERGAYRIDYDKIAENMLGLFADEIAGRAGPVTVLFQ